MTTIEIDYDSPFCHWRSDQWGGRLNVTYRRDQHTYKVMISLLFGDNSPVTEASWHYIHINGEFQAFYTAVPIDIRRTINALMETAGRDLVATHRSDGMNELARIKEMIESRRKQPVRG